MNELQRYYKESLLADLCKEYKSAWQSTHNDKEKLVNLAMRQQSIPHFATFCHDGRGVSREYVKSEFGDYINGKILHDCDGVNGYTYSMFVDVKAIFTNVDVSNIMWCDNVDITVPTSKCPIIYVSNNTHAHISCEGFNSPKIYLFDESIVDIDDIDKESNIIIYKYSEKAKVNLGRFCLGDVKVFDKTLKL